MTKFKFICLCAGLLAGVCSSQAEVPGEFRPQPVLQPEEKVLATGDKIQPAETFPVSRAPLVNTAQRKPKLATPGQPTLRANDLIFDAGWEMIEAPRLKDVNGSALSAPGVDTHDWYDATVPGTVLTTLVNQGVYPDPYFGLNNLLIPESLNKQDYWYRTEFVAPKNFAGRELTLQFNGINFYAEVWFNGNYLGHITGAFIRGNFDVTKLARIGATNVLAVMVGAAAGSWHSPGTIRQVRPAQLRWQNVSGQPHVCLQRRLELDSRHSRPRYRALAGCHFSRQRPGDH